MSPKMRSMFTLSKPAARCRLHALHGTVGAVLTVEERELIVVERLHADREAVDAERPQTLEVLAGELGRVRLDGPLGVGRDVVLRADGAHDGLHVVERGEARGAAAEEERLDAVATRGRRPQFEFAHERRRVVGHEVVEALVRVEVAVAALGGAERDVQVERERLRHDGPQCSCRPHIDESGGPASVQARRCVGNAPPGANPPVLSR